MKANHAEWWFKGRKRFSSIPMTFIRPSNEDITLRSSRESILLLERNISNSPLSGTAYEDLLRSAYGLVNKFSPYDYMNMNFLDKLSLSGKNIGILGVEPIFSLSKMFVEKQWKNQQGLNYILKNKHFSSLVESDPELGFKNTFHMEQVMSILGSTDYENFECYTPDVSVLFTSSRGLEEGVIPEYFNYDIVNNSWMYFFTKNSKKESKTLEFSPEHIVLRGAGNTENRGCHLVCVSSRLKFHPTFKKQSKLV